jgi:methyl-accepting chemotaxis protein
MQEETLPDRSLIGVSETSWLIVSRNDLLDVVTSAIDQFCKGLSEETYQQTSIADHHLVLRSYLHEHWEVLFREIECSTENYSIKLFKRFSDFGLSLDHFKQAQKYILEKVCVYILNKKLYVRKPIGDIMRIMNLVIDDLSFFYSAPLLSDAHIIEDEKKKISRSLKNSVLSIVSSLSGSGSELQETMNGVLKSTQSTQNQSQSMSSMSERFSENVSLVSQATSQLSTSIDEIANQISKTTQMTRKGTEEAKEAEGVVRGLSKAASKIGEVVKIINEIANQTNLLALNATIEAARAGNAGKGFSVVASEVKNLAGQTAKATEEITQQIKAMQDATHQVVTSIEEMTSTIKDINESTYIISSAIEEQGASTQEIFKSIAMVATSSHELVNTISSLNISANEAGSKTQQTLSIASKVTDQSHYLNETIERIMETVLRQHT